VQVDNGSAGAAVAHPLHEFPQAGTCLSSKRVARVTQVVKVDGRKPSGFDGLRPSTTAEVTVPQWGAGRACEDKRVSLGGGELGQVGGQVGHEEAWEGDSAIPGIGLGGPKTWPLPCSSVSVRSMRQRSQHYLDQRPAPYLG